MLSFILDDKAGKFKSDIVEYRPVELIRSQDITKIMEQIVKWLSNNSKKEKMEICNIDKACSQGF